MHYNCLLYFIYTQTTKKTVYTYTVSFGALYSLISRQASISFLSHLSWRSNQANQPTMTLDSTKDSRAIIYNLCTEPLQFTHAIILQTQRIFQHDHIAGKLCFESFMLVFRERCNCFSVAFTALLGCIVYILRKKVDIYDVVRYHTFMMLSYLISFNARISFQSW